MSLHLTEVSFQIHSEPSLLRTRAKRIRRGFDGAVVKLVRLFEISVGAIIVGQVFQKKGVLRIKRCRFLQMGSGVSPFALAALDRANRQITIRGVWQTLFRDRKFVESGLIIAFAIVVIKTEREMRLGQIRL